MTDEQRARERVTRSGAAFEVMLDNLPTAGHPHKGDPDKAAEMRDIIKDAAAEAAAEQDRTDS